MTTPPDKIVFPRPAPGADCYRILVQVAPADIFYVTTLAETYEGLTIPRSIDQRRGILEFLTAPDFVDDTRAMLLAMKKEVSLRFLRA